MLLRNTQEIHRNCIAKNILRKFLIIIRVEKRREMPPQIVPKTADHRNEFMRTFTPVVLNIDDRTMPKNLFSRPLKNNIFHPLDVDFKQAQRWQAYRVQRDDLDIIALCLVQKRNTPEIASVMPVINIRKLHGSSGRTRPGMKGVDIESLIQR